MNDTNSLSHTTWNCKYHIVFAPKYRRKVFYGEKRRFLCASIAVASSLSKGLAVRRIFFATLDSSATLRMTRRILNFTDYSKAGVGVPPNRKHQADNLAKLRQEFFVRGRSCRNY